MNDNHHSLRLINNAFWNSVAPVFQMVIGFFLVPFILGHVNTDLYGIWRLSFSLLTISWILQFGLNSAVNREVPVSIVKQDDGHISRVVSTTFAFYLIISAILLILTAVLIWKFPYWFNVSPENYEISRIVIGITGIGFALWVPLVVFKAVLHGLQAFRFLGIVELVTTIVYAICVFISLKAGGSIISLTILSIGKLIVPAGIFLILSKRLCPDVDIRLSNASFSTLKSIFPYSFNSGIYSIASSFFNQGGIWITGVLLGTIMTAYYSTCIQLTALLSGIVSLMLVVSKPAASQFEAQNDMHRVRLLYMRSVKYVLIAGIAAALYLSIYRKEILWVWLKKEDFVAVSNIVPILAFCQAAWLLQQAGYFVINGIGRHRALALFAVCASVSSLAMAVVLVKVFSLGLTGIAVGTAIPVILNACIVMPLYSCKVLDIRLKDFLSEIVIRPMIPLGVFAITIKCLQMFLPMSECYKLILTLLIGSLALIVSYWYSTNQIEKQMWLSVVSGVYRKKAG